MQKKHLWVGRSKWATPAGGRRAIKGTAHINIRVAGWVGRSKAVTPAGRRRAILYATHSNISVAGTPPPDFGEAVVSSRYSNYISSIFLSESLFTPSSQVLMVGRPAGEQAGKLASNCQTKVAIVCGLLGDVDVLPMVVKEGGCGFKVRGQHPGWEG